MKKLKEFNDDYFTVYETSIINPLNPGLISKTFLWGPYLFNGAIFLYMLTSYSFTRKSITFLAISIVIGKLI